MPAIASIEDLRRVKVDLDALAKDHPDGFKRLVALLEEHRAIGYKNICRMAMGSSPEELKE
jgi:hypothetical protein